VQVQDARRLFVEIADFVLPTDVDDSRDEERDFDVAVTSSDAISDAQFSVSGEVMVIWIYKFKGARFSKRDHFCCSYSNKSTKSENNFV
jgi:hypothetical protein